jgi:chemotaxis protein CheC
MILKGKQLEKLEKINQNSSKRTAVALSQLLGEKVNVSFSDISIKLLNDVYQFKKNHLFSCCHLVGDVTGSTIFVLHEDYSSAITKMILQKLLGSSEKSPKNPKIVLNELTNIITGTYLSTLADHLSFKILPTPPKYFTDPKKADNFVNKSKDGIVLFIKTILSVKSKKIDGELILVLDEKSLKKMIAFLKYSMILS